LQNCIAAILGEAFWGTNCHVFGVFLQKSFFCLLNLSTRKADAFGKKVSRRNLLSGRRRKTLMSQTKGTCLFRNGPIARLIKSSPLQASSTRVPQCRNMFTLRHALTMGSRPFVDSENVESFDAIYCVHTCLFFDPSANSGEGGYFFLIDARATIDRCVFVDEFCPCFFDGGPANIPMIEDVEVASKSALSEWKELSFASFVQPMSFRLWDKRTALVPWPFLLRTLRQREQTSPLVGKEKSGAFHLLVRFHNCLFFGLV